MRNSWLIGMFAGVCSVAWLPAVSVAQQQQQPSDTTQPANADGPTTQPNNGVGRRFGGPGSGGFGGGGGAGGGVPGQPRFFSDDERRAIFTFAHEHLPNLYKVLTDTGRSPRRRALLVFANNRMKALDQVKNDEALSAKLLRNLQAEDELFVFVQQMESASTDREKAEAREKMRGKLKEIVDNFLAERADRIEKLKTKVADEEKKLKEDQANRDQLVDKRVNQFLREFTREPTPDDGSDAVAPGPQPAPGAVNASPDAASGKP